MRNYITRRQCTELWFQYRDTGLDGLALKIGYLFIGTITFLVLLALFFCTLTLIIHGLEKGYLIIESSLWPIIKPLDQLMKLYDRKYRELVFKLKCGRK